MIIQILILLLLLLMAIVNLMLLLAKEQSNMDKIRSETNADFRGNHLPKTTRLKQVLFRSGEQCSKSWRSLTRRRTHKTKEAVLAK